MGKYYKTRETEHYDYPQLCIFQDGITAESFKNELLNKEEIRTPKTVLYIHVPFCKGFCIFCNYYKELQKDSCRLEQYVEALIKEIRTYGEMLPDKLKTITAIHFGGGTPSVMNGKTIQKILDTIKQYFQLEDDCTISMEGSVKNFSQENYMSELSETDINRVSFGIQSFDRPLRTKYGLCDLDKVYKTFENLKKTTIKDINADLMYNFPEQTPEMIIKDIESVLDLDVRTFDLYSLNVFPNTYMQNYLIKNDTLKIHNSNNETNIFQDVYKYIKDSGYAYPIMSNTFSKEKIEPYKFLKYHLGGNELNGGSIIGFGASSRGYIDGIAYKNHVQIDDYIKAIEENDGIAVNVGRVVDDVENNRRTLVMFPNFTKIKKNAFIHDEEIDETIDRLISDGIIKEDKDSLFIETEDCYWAGNISAEFYTKNQKARMTKSLL